MAFKYDFAGWATKYNIKCTDGRTIRHGAFSKCAGKKVPLVYQHNHNDITNVLGSVLLEGRPEGMYAYGAFNNTENAEAAREIVAHGDITALSIFANHLSEKSGNVYHGDIKEVSLVLAGANEGATIEFPIIDVSTRPMSRRRIARTGDDSGRVITSPKKDYSKNDYMMKGRVPIHPSF